MPVLAVLTGILLWRGIYRQFPYFLMYVISGELVGLTRFLVHRFFLRWYFQAYWMSDVLIELFALLACYELFIKRLFSRFYAIRFYRYLFPATAVGIALIVVPAMLQAKKINALLAAVHAVEVLRVMILIFFIGLMTFMGRRWTRYELGLALGLSVQAAVLLITSASWLLTPRAILSTWFPVVAYDIACVSWLITFLKREEQPLSAEPVSSEVLHEARKWEETLKESFTTKKQSD